MSYIIKIINTVLSSPEAERSGHITSIRLDVGEMTGALSEYLNMYFKEAAKGTPLEGASLEIKSIPVTAKCEDCGNIYIPQRSGGYLCPVCKSSRGIIIKGRDIIVDSIVCD